MDDCYSAFAIGKYLQLLFLEQNHCMSVHVGCCMLLEHQCPNFSRALNESRMVILLREDFIVKLTADDALK